jgi:hypothetical protein
MDLSQPRVMLIAFYPGSMNPEGHIIHCKTPKHRTYTQPLEWYKKYPKIFRELQYWEFREVTEMPEYLKHGNLIFKVELAEYNIEKAYCRLPSGNALWLEYCQPSTKEEYDSYMELSKSTV